jgi:hypothetical protein
MRILPYISFIDAVSGVVGRGLGLGVVGIRRILIRHNVGIMRRGLKKYAGGFGCLVHRGRRIRVPPCKSSEFMYPYPHRPLSTNIFFLHTVKTDMICLGILTCLPLSNVIFIIPVSASFFRLSTHIQFKLSDRLFCYIL